MSGGKASPLRGVPEGLGIGHFNALRGRDEWKKALWLGIVGRTLPQEGDLRDLAAVIDGQPADPAATVWRDAVLGGRQEPGAGVGAREDGAGEKRMGSSRRCWTRSAGSGRPQAVGRVRLVRRGGEGVAMTLSNHPVPRIAVNELMSSEMMEGHDAEALRRPGVSC